MKTSLLLMSLVMGMGLVGTAQAANVTAGASSTSNVHGQALVAMSVSGNGVFSTLSEILSGKTKKTDSAQACSAATAHATDKPKPCQPPGATPGAPANPHRHRTPPGADASRSSSDGDPSPSSASSAGPVLGWQSLLPGSIQ